MWYKACRCDGYNRDRGIRPGDFILKVKSAGGELLIPKYYDTKRSSIVCDRIALKSASSSEVRNLTFMDCISRYASEVEISVKVVLTQNTLDTVPESFVHIWLEPIDE